MLVYNYAYSTFFVHSKTLRTYKFIFKESFCLFEMVVDGQGTNKLRTTVVPVVESVTANDACIEQGGHDCVFNLRNLPESNRIYW